jgi:hypothetical protein
MESIKQVEDILGASLKDLIGTLVEIRDYSMETDSSGNGYATYMAEFLGVQKDERGDYGVAIRREDSIEVDLIHPSCLLIAEREAGYKKMEYFKYEEECEVHTRMVEEQITSKPLCSCGSKQAPISGDDVHFGYTGWPICPDCKRS